jgi:hypothetical protein
MNLADELRKLAELREAGHLTDQEFADAKRRLIAEAGAEPPPLPKQEQTVPGRAAPPTSVPPPLPKEEQTVPARVAPQLPQQSAQRIKRGCTALLIGFAVIFAVIVVVAIIGSLTNPSGSQSRSSASPSNAPAATATATSAQPSGTPVATTPPESKATSMRDSSGSTTASSITSKETATPVASAIAGSLDQIQIYSNRQQVFNDGRQKFVVAATNTSDQLFKGTVKVIAVDEIDKRIDSDTMYLDDGLPPGVRVLRAPARALALRVHGLFCSAVE